MKKQLITLFLGLVSVISFAQKSEMRTAEKAIRKSQFAEAITAIDAAEALMANMDDKQKAEFYFLKGQANAGKKNYKVAAESFNQLMSLEKETGRDKYTKEAAPMLNDLIMEVSNRGSKLYNEDKDYKAAAKDFYLTYLLSPKDTSFLYNAAVSSYQAEDYESSLKYYRKLKEVNYTGVATQYLATNKTTGEVENFASKQQRDLVIKTGDYLKPEQTLTESKQGDIIKSIGYILSQQGKIDEAIAAMKEARAADPKDLQLILAEADLYIKLDKMDEFGKLMAQAVELDPTNQRLFFNLGVVNANEGKTEEAIKYYKKAIELDPEYADAYTNLAIAILAEEKAIVEEMNKNLSDFDKYDALLVKQKNVYRKALPYLEKSDAIKTDAQTVQTLLNIYQVLEMDAKSKEYKAKYDSLKE